MLDKYLVMYGANGSPAGGTYKFYDIVGYNPDTEMIQVKRLGEEDGIHGIYKEFRNKVVQSQEGFAICIFTTTNWITPKLLINLKSKLDEYESKK